MSIGSSITLSVPTVGTTAKTLSKAYDGTWRDVTSVTNSNGDVIPIEITLRPASVAGPQRHVSGTLRHRPAAFDGVLGASQGQVSVSFTVAGTIGEDISQTDIRDFAQYLASVLTQAGIMDSLLSGSAE